MSLWGKQTCACTSRALTERARWSTNIMLVGGLGAAVDPVPERSVDIRAVSGSCLRDEVQD